MTFYRHLMAGPNPAGDVWNATLHTNSAQTLAAVHAQFVTSITTFWGAATEALFPSNEQVTTLTTTQLDPVTGRNVAQVSTAVSFKGTAGAISLPQRSAVVVGLRTALPTRAGRGRLYLPAVAPGATDAAGNLLTATATTIATNFAAFCTGMTTIAPVNIYHAATKTGTVVTSVTVSTVMGSQRRRTNKLLPNYQSHTV